MALIGTIVDAHSFDWKDGVGVQEISNFKGQEHIFFGRLYDDACDQGFRLVNQRTAKIEAFYFDSKDVDAEGEVSGWCFRPINRNLREGGVRILLIND